MTRHVIVIWQNVRGAGIDRHPVRVGGAFTREAAIVKIHKIARELGGSRGRLGRRGDRLGIEAAGGFVYIDDPR